MIALGFFEPAVARFPAKRCAKSCARLCGRSSPKFMIDARDSALAGVASDFPILGKPTSRGHRLVYLDSAATSQKPRPVIDALSTYYEEYNANIHRGVYEIAARATDAFELARAKIATFINARESEVVFTRNTTEAINLVAYSWGNANVKNRRRDSRQRTRAPLEPGSLADAGRADRRGAALHPVDERGLLVLDDLDKLLDGCKIVAIGHASNALGTIAPLDVIIPRAHAAGALVLVDGAQGAPHFGLDVKTLDADFYAFSGHKMLGPTGIGVLYAKHVLLDAMPPFLTGGDMIHRVGYRHSTFNTPPWKFEAGTSNVADAIGLGVAVDYLSNIGMDVVRQHERDLTAYALARLEEFEGRGLDVYGPRDADRISGVISFNLGDIHAHDLASILDTEGICIRAGHHCAMPLMDKMGWAATARASFYLYNTQADVDALMDGLHAAARIFKI